jgi:hypothetical protein
VPYSKIEALGHEATELVNVVIYECILYLTGEDTSRAYVSLTHPEVVSQWKRARKIIENKRRDLASRRFLDAQAILWDFNGRRPEDRWLKGELVSTAETLLRSDISSLPLLTQEFLKTFETEAIQEKPKFGRLKRLVKPLTLILFTSALIRMVPVNAGMDTASTETASSDIKEAAQEEDESGSILIEETPESSFDANNASFSAFLGT